MLSTSLQSREEGKCGWGEGEEFIAVPFAWSMPELTVGYGHGEAHVGEDKENRRVQKNLLDLPHEGILFS